MLKCMFANISPEVFKRSSSLTPKKDLSKDNLIRKVVLEQSQKLGMKKILFSRPETLCTIRIICVQDVREVLFPYKTQADSPSSWTSETLKVSL